MSGRVASLARIAAVQRQVKRIADWRLAEAEREAADAAESRAAIQAYIAETAPTGALAEAAVRQALRSGARDERAHKAAAAAAAAAREASARAKLVARRLEEAHRAENDARERKTLERLIDDALARRQDRAAEID